LLARSATGGAGVIDRTDHDIETESKTRRETVDDDPEPEHSLDPNEHYGQESDIPTETELRDLAETDGD
jgi:hypothetical protein